MADQEWQYNEFAAPGGAQAVVDFLNEPLRQGAGEASVTLRNDGSAALLWLEPGSLGESTAQTWQVSDFAGPSGEQALVAFLNEPLRQGDGEASATLRNDGSAGLVWLEPGTLGESTAQTWQPREFAAPDGTQAAATFLNEPLRQGAGEASVTPRGNGTAGLVWLEPGSLGESTGQEWLVAQFEGPNGGKAAADFLNEAPRQGRGEASVFVRNDGSAVVLYLEPGTA